MTQWSHNNDAQNALATLAARYKGRSHVIYALQVEPHEEGGIVVTVDDRVQGTVPHQSLRHLVLLPIEAAGHSRSLASIVPSSR